ASIVGHVDLDAAIQSLTDYLHAVELVQHVERCVTVNDTDRVVSPEGRHAACRGVDSCNGRTRHDSRADVGVCCLFRRDACLVSCDWLRIHVQRVAGLANNAERHQLASVALVHETYRVDARYSDNVASSEVCTLTNTQR